MGADLYINSIYEPQHAKIEPLFNQAVALRNSLPEGSAERQRAQTQVQEYADQLYAAGYFRDPYNNWDLLWQFGLSWWNDVVPKLDQDDNLAPREATWLLRNLQSREQRFEMAIRDLPAKHQEYFRERYEVLRAFLNSAIERNESILCSL
jgi:hypothetical protein